MLTVIQICDIIIVQKKRKEPKRRTKDEKNNVYLQRAEIPRPMVDC